MQSLGKNPTGILFTGRLVFSHIRVDAPAWPETILAGQAALILIARPWAWRAEPAFRDDSTASTPTDFF
jgi:hypothetical protein